MELEHERNSSNEEDPSTFPLRVAQGLVFLLMGVSCGGGTLSFLLCGGLLSRDPSVWWVASGVEGGVVSVVGVVFTAIVVLIHGIVWVGLLLRKPWGRVGTVAIGGLYLCTALLPVGILLLWSSLSADTRALCPPAEPVG